MKNVSTWKKSVLFGVGFVFVSCCALGSVASKTASSKQAKAMPTSTAIATHTTLPTATTAPATAIIAATRTIAPIIKQKATRVAKPTSVAPTGDSYPCQPGQIKANTESKKYHVPTGASYGKTVKHVLCFDTAEQAEAAGFKRAKR